MSTQPDPKPVPLPTEEREPTPEELEDRLFEALWYGTVDGEVFDGDPADLW